MDPVVDTDAVAKPECETATTTAIENAFAQLVKETDPEEFVSTLKLWASKRTVLTREEKLTLIDSTLAHMDSLGADLLSSCVWSLGIIGYSIDQQASSFSSSSFKTTEGKSLNSYSKGGNAIRLSGGVISKLVAHIERVASTTQNTEILCRVIGGMSKMGYQWADLPKSVKSAVIELLSGYNDMATATTGSSDVAAAVHGKDIAIICYTLGQLKAKKRDVSKKGLTGLLNTLKGSLQDHSMTNQGIVNSLNGLQRLGLSWDEELAEVTGLHENILKASTKALITMRQDEVCSLLHSLANLRASWNRSLPAELRVALSEELMKHAPTLNNREIANIYWALGKVHYSYVAGGTLEERLGEALRRRAHTFNQFDVESTFVGLGLMEAPYTSLPSEAQKSLLGKMSSQVDSMNIFKLYNVLWGMARVGISIDSPVLSQETSRKLWTKTVSVFHTFLRRHYGDVMWALGSLGYRLDDLSADDIVNGNGVISNEKDRGRILAILTRVFSNFDTREAAYVLWGLGRMGIRWESDMSSETQSIEEGDTVAPMAKVVSLYLKRQKFREHDYAVLLYSMGALGVRFHDNLSTGIVLKLNKVIPHVGPYFSSRSLCNALDGLATCGTLWADIAGGEEIRQAFFHAMLIRRDGAVDAVADSTDNNDGGGTAATSTTTTSTSSDRVIESNSSVFDAFDSNSVVLRHDKLNNYRRGIHGMNALEVTKTLDCLARMSVDWKRDLPLAIQAVAEEVIKRETANLTEYNAGVIKKAMETMNGPQI
jgi:hypothetical protein